MPCYNEEFRLNVTAFSEFLVLNKDNYNILFVNDGSTDGTLTVLSKIVSYFPDNCFIYDLKKNRGKAEAVRQGVNVAAERMKYEYTFKIKG